MNGEGVLRVTFLGTVSELAGECWCGRTYTSADPREMWSWLEEHEHRPA
ncbi:hypothetical protein [Microtetraspora malaysiensis]